MLRGVSHELTSPSDKHENNNRHLELIRRVVSVRLASADFGSCAYIPHMCPVVHPDRADYRICETIVAHADSVFLQHGRQLASAPLRWLAPPRVCFWIRGIRELAAPEHNKGDCAGDKAQHHCETPSRHGGGGGQSRRPTHQTGDRKQQPRVPPRGGALQPDAVHACIAGALCASLLCLTS